MTQSNPGATHAKDQSMQALKGRVIVDATTITDIHAAFSAIDDSDAELRDVERAQANAAAAPKNIKLNIGGRIFETSKNNVIQHPTSFLYAMVTSDDWQPRAQDGACFIDANFKHFDRVMTYLRSGNMYLDGLCASEVSQLNFTLRTLLMEHLEIQQMEERRKQAIQEISDAYTKLAAAIKVDKTKLQAARSHRQSFQAADAARAAYTLLSQSHWRPREDGAYFIDQDPTYFEYALDALQGTLNTSGLSPTAIHQVYQLFNYLQMQTY
ncbi:hypothetical protein SDRG_10101 [Saprolegnia diclina VS20]|uniref:Potassium channel tetramerisation-type BTB domain-containing protein n=1 Tax=Saprolegnia diclina (strain VS20) TaxID=1156394 RepID=T0Q3D9_SAPDV|nr:hypothetical protein SDRG_10101 [Saprolegnia diclina VS20]EQC32354.1 hypothetical protein SDRG_10101 [Saprolegnia diclina VS20]|eukprot:XP_008614295.1 hypothetical protein SDRG_10101 [Saprolegnia diclina VS20]